MKLNDNKITFAICRFSHSKALYNKKRKKIEIYCNPIDIELQSDIIEHIKDGKVETLDMQYCFLIPIQLDKIIKDSNNLSGVKTLNLCNNYITKDSIIKLIQDTKIENLILDLKSFDSKSSNDIKEIISLNKKSNNPIKIEFDGLKEKLEKYPNSEKFKLLNKITKETYKEYREKAYKQNKLNFIFSLKENRFFQDSKTSANYIAKLKFKK